MKPAIPARARHSARLIEERIRERLEATGSSATADRAMVRILLRGRGRGGGGNAAQLGSPHQARGLCYCKLLAIVEPVTAGCPEGRLKLRRSPGQHPANA